MLSRMQVKYHVQNNLGTIELSFEFISQESKKKKRKYLQVFSCCNVVVS